ncbi:lamin tail domain-containing protein [Asanoa siamensis]|uniref:LTD domain-containing protein n=1 Tax=Asanoa siamensis TaxID=926357 RepID=A0ABQ4CQM7_9ACTN|nr:lamin tail domain-containing protein [Asanoa siamensis]GIF73601.1 hypothetical protein Asi02nite_31190 [Asanoa siamensis]
MRKLLGLTCAAAIAFGAVLAGAASASADPGDRGRGPGRAPQANVQISGIQYDAPGRDSRANSSLNGEWISIVNNGRRAVNLRGYTIKDRANHVFRFNNNTWLGGGERIRVHTGFGRANDNQAFWGSRTHIWNNEGDVATLSGPRGARLDTCAYRGSVRGNGFVRC